MNPENPPIQKIEVEVTAETAHDIENLVQEMGWDYAEGIRILLGSGLGAIRAQAALEAHQCQDPDAEPIERMGRRLMEVESSLAVLRFRLFETNRDNEAWNLSTGAIRNENIGLKNLVERQREEINALKATLAELRARLAVCEANAPSETPEIASSPVKASLLDRLRVKWGGG